VNMVDTQTFFQISLIAAYIAGMVALFAPCCISYLLPAYLGNVFKERGRILLMTLVYSLGIFVVMLPIVLGAKALQMLFFDLHDSTYIFGGIFMLFVAIVTFLGIKMPMPHFAMKSGKPQADVVSTFTLGVFSGVTSACCAPVLVGILTLSSLAPNTFQALLVGAFYVLGMVTPLYIASLFIHKKNILQKPVLKRIVTEVKIRGRVYPIFVANIVGSAIFLLTALVMIYLASAGKLGMTDAESAVTQSIYQVAEKVTEITDFAVVNIVFAILGAFLLYKYIKRVKKEASKCCDE
jgi:cytochrome c-type biogenesis protein